MYFLSHLLISEVQKPNMKAGSKENKPDHLSVLVCVLLSHFLYV